MSVVLQPPSQSKRAAMQRQREKDTRPEMELRRRLHRAGFRYKTHARPLPELRRTVDLVFARERVAVEVRGCFWHMCPTHATFPKTNEQFWLAKLTRNRERDAETATALRKAGWRLVVVWEHEKPEEAARRVERCVLLRRARVKK